MIRYSKISKSIKIQFQLALKTPKRKKEQLSSSLTSCLPCPCGPCRSNAAPMTCLAAGDEPESSNVAPWKARITKTINKIFRILKRRNSQ